MKAQTIETALLRKASGALRAMLKAERKGRSCEADAIAAEAARAKAREAVRAIQNYRRPPRAKPNPDEELFSITYFMPRPQPAPGLEGCLINPLEPDGPPAGRQALIDRLLKIRTER